MRLTRRIIVNAIGFAVLGTGLIVLLGVRVLPTVFGSTYPIYAIFPSTGGVVANQEVTYRGVQVGHVGQMTLTTNAVKIEMVIKGGTQIPKEGTRARVLFKSAVGEQFIDLLPARTGGPMMKAGDVIPMSMTSVPAQTEDLLRSLDRVLEAIDPKDLGTVVHELGQGLSGHGEDLQALVQATNVLSGIATKHQKEITALFRDSASVQDAFNQSRRDFVQGVSSLRAIGETLDTRRDDIARLVSASETLDTNILALLTDRSRDLNDAISGTATTVRLYHRQLDDLDQILVFFNPFLTDFFRAYGAPYFNVNLLLNTEAPSCSYDPSSRPVRQVTDTSHKSPTTSFDCAAGTQATGGADTPPSVEILRERLSWLSLFTLGY